MKVTLRRSEVRALADALSALEGKQEQAKDGNGKNVGMVNVPYDLSGRARYALAKTLRSIQAEVDAMDAVRAGMIAKARATPQDQQNQSWQANLEKELTDFLNQTTELEVHALPITELKIETNKLGPRMLAALDPMLEGEVT